METRARYVLIGLFMLAATAAGFGFVYWLQHAGGLGERAAYRIRFQYSASGLRPGSAVLFNGIRVGEVTQVRLNAADPREVTVLIAIERGTPVRADTRVEIYTQGLMGSPAVALIGGTPGAAPPTALPGEPPLISAAPGTGQDLMQAARELVLHVDKVVGENAEALRSTIANLNTFAAALGRNSDKVDAIAEGLMRLTGGGPAKAPPTLYDLTAPKDFPALSKIPNAQLAVNEVTAVLELDTQLIRVSSTVGAAPSFPDARWGDSLPKLFQARIVQSFENAKFPRVNRGYEGFAAEYQLLVDLRNFRVMISPDPVAQVEFSAKILNTKGQIVGSRIVSAAVPAKGISEQAAAAALNEAFQKALTDLVLWTSTTI